MGYAKYEGDDDTPLRVNSPSLIAAYVRSDDVRNIVQVTQAEYDLLTPVATTLYVVVG